MSTYFIADLHLGHKNILKFSSRSKWIPSMDVHDDILKERYSGVISKRDLVFFLGDVAWTTEALQQLEEWPGRKRLVRGNHDNLNEGLYQRVFEKIYGAVMYKQFWLSHVPLHPTEVSLQYRKEFNVHGHLHDNVIKRWYREDKRYINVCVEKLLGLPVSLEELRERTNACRSVRRRE